MSHILHMHRYRIGPTVKNVTLKNAEKTYNNNNKMYEKVIQ